MNGLEVKKADGYIVAVPPGKEAYYIEKTAEKLPWGGEIKKLVIRPLGEIPASERVKLEELERKLPAGVRIPRLPVPEFEEEEIPKEKREEFRKALAEILEYYHIPEKVSEGIKKLAEIAGTSVRRLVGWLRKIGIEKKEEKLKEVV